MKLIQSSDEEIVNRKVGIPLPQEIFPEISKSKCGMSECEAAIICALKLEKQQVGRALPRALPITSISLLNR
jgi:hypothetical protein